MFDKMTAVRIYALVVLMERMVNAVRKAEGKTYGEFHRAVTAEFELLLEVLHISADEQKLLDAVFNNMPNSNVVKEAMGHIDYQATEYATMRQHMVDLLNHAAAECDHRFRLVKVTA